MQQVVDYLLRLASVEARHELQDAKIISLGSLINQQLVELGSQTAERQISFSQSPNVSSDNVFGEEFLLGQAVRNIVQNALDFTDSDGEITISLDQYNDRSGNRLKLLIYNNGSAIPEYAIGKVFDRFYSLPCANGQKSTGLGLVLTRTIIELHNGKIELSNAATQGVNVAVTLPIA